MGDQGHRRESPPDKGGTMTMTDTTESALRWAAPGPGSWTNDRAYKRATYTVPMQLVMATAMRDGFGRWTERYGVPISHLDLRFVNDHPYVRPVFVGAGDRSG